MQNGVNGFFRRTRTFYRDKRVDLFGRRVREETSGHLREKPPAKILPRLAKCALSYQGIRPGRHGIAGRTWWSDNSRWSCRCPEHPGGGGLVHPGPHTPPRRPPG